MDDAYYERDADYPQESGHEYHVHYNDDQHYRDCDFHVQSPMSR